MKRFLIGLVLGFAVVATASHVQASIIESNGDFQLLSSSPEPGQPNPPLIDITRLTGGGGRVYTNQVTGLPFALGSTVRTVGVVPMSTAVNGTNLGVTLPDGSPLIVIFGIEGTIVPSAIPGIVSAEFSIGRAFLASTRTGNGTLPFGINNPASWNFDNVFAQFDLLPQQSVIDGAPPITGFTGTTVDGSAHVPFPESVTNISGVNTVSTFSNVQGIFLFGEASTPDQNAGVGFANPGLGAFTGDDFLRNVDTAAIFPPKAFEALITVTSQTSLGSPISPTGGTGVLDTIGTAAGFTGLFSEGGYTPTGFGAGTGDFVANISVENYIGFVPVPEMGSLMTWSVISLCVGCLRYNRTRRQTQCL